MDYGYLLVICDFCPACICLTHQKLEILFTYDQVIVDFMDFSDRLVSKIIKTCQLYLPKDNTSASSLPYIIIKIIGRGIADFVMVSQRVDCCCGYVTFLIDISLILVNLF